MTVALGTVWVVNGGDDTVSRFNEGGKALGSATKVGRGPHDIAADAAGAWVTNGEDGTVTRLDADGRAQGKPIRVGRDPAGILLADGVAWVTNRSDNTVSRIDATEGEVIGDPIGVGRAPSGLAAGDGAIWVTNTADGTVAPARSRDRRPHRRPAPGGQGARRRHDGRVLGVGRRRDRVRSAVRAPTGVIQPRAD